MPQAPDAASTAALSEANVLLRMSGDAIVVLRACRDETGRIHDFTVLFANDAALLRGKTTRESAYGTQIGAPLGVTGAALIAWYARVVETQAVDEREVRSDELPGWPVRWVQHRVLPLLDGVAVVSRDVSSWRQESERLREANKFLDSIIDHVPAMVFVKDAKELRIQRFNRTGAQLVGVPQSSMIGKTDYDLFPPEQAAFYQKCDRDVLGSGALVTVEEPIQTTDGEHWLQTMKIPVPDENGRPAYLLGISIDITERRNAEQRAQLHEVVMGTISDGLCIVRTATSTVAYTNPALDRMLGHAAGELLERPFHELHAAAATNSAEVTLRRRDGGALWCRVRRVPLAHSPFGDADVYVFEDITAWRQMQSSLMLNDRMASVGTLAAGVAHEVNNPLSYVVSNLELVAESLLLDSNTPPLFDVHEIAEMISDARHGAERVQKIVSALKTFSRVDEERRAVISVAPVLETSIGMAFNELRHRARIVREFGPTPLVEADSGRLGQVIINLLLNAAQAIPEGNAAMHTVSISSRTDSAGRAVIEVRDTGTGIAKDVVGRIFDPFFTTKPVGEGTGIGLSICHNIIAGLGGTITVESEEGHGAVFTVAIPAAQRPVSTPANRPRAAASARRGTILVVDDESMVGVTLTRVLKQHDVTFVQDGREALALLGAGKRYDVIISDVMMPEMSGVELYDEIGTRWPELTSRIIFVTGGAFTPVTHAFLDRVKNERIEKPFAPNTVRVLVDKYITVS